MLSAASAIEPSKRTDLRASAHQLRPLPPRLRWTPVPWNIRAVSLRRLLPDASLARPA
jgi:hypothetical protein